MHKEKYPGYNFTEITFNLSTEAIIWLSGTTRDNAHKHFRNFDFFLSLLKEMRTDTGLDTRFRRPIELDPLDVQFSEISLAQKWNLGRKKMHNLLMKMEALGLIEVTNRRVGSWLTFKCVSNWRDDRESKEQSLSQDPPLNR
ncbi:MAG: hypothetical protein J1F12_09090 [Muribaculaceae bacterium]|nr:hypothetical protein [Muribaculaceae bacterium]